MCPWWSILSFSPPFFSLQEILDDDSMMVGFVSSMGGSLLAGFARVSLTGALGDDDASAADGVLALVALH
jgi:hypothetical protein